MLIEGTYQTSLMRGRTQENSTLQRLKDEKAVLEGSVNYLRARMAVESALATPSSSGSGSSSSSEEGSGESSDPPAAPSSSSSESEPPPPPAQQGPD